MSDATINKFPNRQNVNIILTPMAAMEDMEPHKWLCTMFDNARLSLLRVKCF